MAADIAQRVASLEGSALQQHEADMLGMHYSSDKLDETLRLAKACLRSARLPGDPRMRDFNRKFEEEAAEKAAAIAAKKASERRNSLQQLQLQAAAVPPKCPPTPEQLSGEAYIAKLRRDISRLERCTSDSRQELEAVQADVVKEVLVRCAAQEEARAAELAVQKARKSVKEIRDQHRIQEREIEDLNAVIRSYEEKKTASSQCKTRRNDSSDQTSVPAGASNVTGSQLDETRLAQHAPATSSGLKVGDLGPGGQVVLENNGQLASVIDAVGELSKQLQSRRNSNGPALSGPQDVEGELPPSRRAEPLSGSQSDRSHRVDLGLNRYIGGNAAFELPEKSVLARGPGEFKHYWLPTGG